MRNRHRRSHRDNSGTSSEKSHSLSHQNPRSRPHQRNDRGRRGPRENRTSQTEIIFGIEPIRELIAASPSAIRTLYIKDGAQEKFGDEIGAVREAGGQVTSTDAATLNRMAGSESRHQGLIASIREFNYAPLTDVLELKPDPLLVIDGVTDPRNLGAIMRSAECAGAGAVLIARDRTAGVTPAAVKSSSGAWAHLRIARCGNVAQTLEALKAEGYWIAVLAPEGDTSIYEIDPTRRLAIVLGSEDRGARELVKKTADFVLRIPMYGRVSSLNVSVAAAVTLFELSRRRGTEEPAPGNV